MFQAMGNTNAGREGDGPAHRQRVGEHRAAHQALLWFHYISHAKGPSAAHRMVLSCKLNHQTKLQFPQGAGQYLVQGILAEKWHPGALDPAHPG